MHDRLERYADLIVNFGANVQPGQILDVGSGLGKEELTRALTASAYKRGAKFVDVNYWDPHLKRVRVQYAADDVLDFVPPWYGERTLQLGEERGATILLSGPIAPRPSEKWAKLVYPDLDPAEALEKLWKQVLHVCRMDDDDPESSWRQRSAALKGVA